MKRIRILIYGETHGKGLSPVTRELVGKSRALAREISGKNALAYSLALISDRAESCRAELSAYGLSRIYVWKDAGDLRADRYADLLAETIRQEEPAPRRAVPWPPAWRQNSAPASPPTARSLRWTRKTG